MGAFSLRVFKVGLWSGFVRVHGKESALLFHARETVSAIFKRARNGGTQNHRRWNKEH